MSKLKQSKYQSEQLVGFLYLFLEIFSGIFGSKYCVFPVLSLDPAKREHMISVVVSRTCLMLKQLLFTYLDLFVQVIYLLLQVAGNLLRLVDLSLFGEYLAVK